MALGVYGEIEIKQGKRAVLLWVYYIKNMLWKVKITGFFFFYRVSLVGMKNVRFWKERSIKTQILRFYMLKEVAYYVNIFQWIK